MDELLGLGSVELLDGPPIEEEESEDEVVSIIELPDTMSELVEDIIKLLDDVVSDDKEVCTTEVLEADMIGSLVEPAEEVVELTVLLGDTNGEEELVETIGSTELDALLSGRLLDVALCALELPGTTTVPKVPDPDGCSV